MSARWGKLRIALSEAQNHRCAYCGRIMALDGWSCVELWSDDLATVDHVIPVSRGGNSLRDNLVAARKRCNTLRGNMRAQRFAALMAKAKTGSPRKALRRIRFIQRLRSKGLCAVVTPITHPTGTDP